MIRGSIGNAELYSMLTSCGSAILTLYLKNNILVMLIVIKSSGKNIGDILFQKFENHLSTRAHKVVENWVGDD